MLAYIGCLGYTMIYAMRTNMSIAIVCMVKTEITSAVNITGKISEANVCGIAKNTLNSSKVLSHKRIMYSASAMFYFCFEFV